jgi:hypothetical protein
LDAACTLIVVAGSGLLVLCEVGIVLLDTQPIIRPIAKARTIAPAKPPTLIVRFGLSDSLL